MYSFYSQPDTNLLNAPPNVMQLARQAEGEQNQVQAGQLQNLSAGQNYAAAVLGTAGMSGNPDLYASAKAHLNGMGLDVSDYSDNPAIGVRQAQLSRMYGATPTQALRAMVMEQEMAQRAGSEAGNSTMYGWAPGIDNGLNMMMPNGQPATNAAPAANPPATSSNPPAANNPAPAGNLPPSNTVMTPIASAAPVAATAATSSTPSASSPMPVQQPNETVQHLQTRINAWKEQNAINPEIQGNVARSEAEQKATPEMVKQLNEDALTSSNLVNSISEIQQAAAVAKTGAFGPAKAALMKAADWLGLPESMVPEVTGYGDIAKISNDLIGAAAKGAGQASRLQGEFKAIQGAVPGLSLDPNAMNSLLPLLSRKNYQIIREQNAWNDYSKANPNASFNSFATPWEANELKQQQTQGGNLPSYPLPNLPAKGSAAAEQNGQSQKSPYQPNQIVSSKNGVKFVFKGGNWQDPNNYQQVGAPNAR